MAANSLCKSLQSSNVNSPSGNYVCVPGFTNQASNLQSGVKFGTPCSVTMNNADKTTSVGTYPSMCGYNQNGNSYCPWMAGDAIPAALIQAV